MDAAFETLRRLHRRACRRISPRAIRARRSDSEGVHRAAIRAKALDTLRGHAAGGDAVERRASTAPARRMKRCCCGCARIRSHEVQRRAPTQMLVELRKLIPAFLTRVDQPERGGALEPVSRVRRATRPATRAAALLARRRVPSRATKSRSRDFDPDGEIKVVAAALYASAGAARTISCSPSRAA